MPFYGPLTLSGGTGTQGLATPGGQSYVPGIQGNPIQALLARFPGITGLTSYPGQGGAGLGALGFTHPRADLFSGQTPGTLEEAFQQGLQLEGVGGVTPGSVTAALAGVQFQGGGPSGTGTQGGRASITGPTAPGLSSLGSIVPDTPSSLSGFLSGGAETLAQGGIFGRGITNAMGNTPGSDVLGAVANQGIGLIPGVGQVLGFGNRLASGLQDIASMQADPMYASPQVGQQTQQLAQQHEGYQGVFDPFGPSPISPAQLGNQPVMGSLNPQTEGINITSSPFVGPNVTGGPIGGSGEGFSGSVAGEGFAGGESFGSFSPGGLGGFGGGIAGEGGGGNVNQRPGVFAVPGVVPNSYEIAVSGGNVFDFESGQHTPIFLGAGGPRGIQREGQYIYTVNPNADRGNLPADVSNPYPFQSENWGEWQRQHGLQDYIGPTAENISMMNMIGNFGMGEPGAEGAGPGAGGAAGGDAGDSVLCTEAHRRGWLPDALYAADCAYGATLPPDTLRGYHRWAIPLAHLMRRSDLVAHVLRPFLVAWARHVAGQPTWTGAFLMRGLPLMAWLGRPPAHPQPA